MRQLFAEARRYAQLNVPVLLLGERGTGKTTLASWIRMNSPFRREEQDSHWPAVAGGQYTLFAEQALYHSTFVGEFTGRAAIRSMMTDFFARFPDVYWTVTEYRSVDERTVEFTFTMTATAAATGQAVQRQARETLEFTDAGLIARLSVNDL
jgi:hypothetical protein